MRIKTLLVAILSFWVADLLAQPQTYLYRDPQEAYKRGIDFYEQSLYGKAIEEFQYCITNTYIDEGAEIPPYVVEAKLFNALCALRLNKPDAEKLLLGFVEDYSPSTTANRAILEIGGYYFGQQDYKKAVTYYDRVDRSTLKNELMGDVYFKQGYSYFVTKNFPKAKAAFSQIINVQNTQYYPANYYYGVTTFFMNDFNTALTSFQRVEKSGTYQKVVPYYISQILFAQKKYDQVLSYAVPVYESKNANNLPEMGQIIGQSYFEKGDYNKAAPYMADYVKNAPKVSRDGVYQYAFVKMETGDCATALPEFEKVATTNDAMGQNALYNIGACNLKLNKKQEARTAFFSASKLNFNTQLQSEAFYNYAKLCAELSYDNEAVDALQKIPGNSPYYAESQQILSDVFMNTKDYDKALGIIRKITPKTPRIRETYQKVAFYRGVQLYKDGKRNDALGLFEESLDNPIDPSLANQSQFWIAEIQHDKNDYKNSNKSYLKFIQSISQSKDLPDNVSKATANYGMGYNYLKLEDYSNAAKSFDASIVDIDKNRRNIKDAYVSDVIYSDAQVKAGDAHLMQNQYDKALVYYNGVINSGKSNVDYALYQKSNILKVKGKTTEQITVLEDIVNSHPSSPYADDALYNQSLVFNELNRPQNAIAVLRTLLSKYPNSDYKNRALQRLGLIHYNMNEREKALDFYKQVVTNDPTSEEAKTSLITIKEIYTDLGNTEGYIAFVESVKGHKVTDSEKEELTFTSAEKLYLDDKYDQAIPSLSNYLEKFPKGVNNMKARFYRADSYYSLKRYSDALFDYDYILSKNSAQYGRLSALRAAETSYRHQKNYDKAFDYYLLLEAIATDDEEKMMGTIGAMRSAYLGSKKAQMPVIADRVIKSPKATKEDKAEAYYYVGKNHFDNRKYDDAKFVFTQVSTLSPGTNQAAEADYHIAYCIYAKRDLRAAEAKCYDNSESLGGYPYWLVKNFLLLSDVFAEQNKIVQAKATLESIIDSGFDEDPSLIEEAKTKLRNLNAAPKPLNNLMPEPGKSDLLELDHSGGK